MESEHLNHKIQPLLFTLVLIGGMFLGYKLARQSGISQLGNKQSSQLDDVIQLLSDKYVDSLDKAALFAGGVDGIIKKLDPHTVYIPSTDLGKANEELEGKFYGIGVEFFMVKDTVIVSGIIPNGPSENKNILAGDKIIKIDDSVVAGKNISDEDIIRRIRGQKNTTILIELQRLDNSKRLVKIERGNVPLRSVSAYFTINDEIGFIKIDLFSETTYDEFKDALQKLQKQGIRKLIIDVRDNPGGYMEAVAKVADELVAGKKTIVRTKGKSRMDSLVTKEVGLFEEGKLCILIDENSASASEILAGAIQDLDRGTIIGRRSYGKGLVQEQFELPNNSAIRITTARYYLPSGRSIQRSYKDGNAKYKHDIIDRYTNGDLNKEDSVRNKSVQYFTSKKRIVYGEEGIRPDIFIALDTIYHPELDEFYTQHVAERFAQEYYFMHKNDFSLFATTAVFSKNFSLNGNILAALKNRCKFTGINMQIFNNQGLFNDISKIVKAQFAKLLYGNNGKIKEMYVDDAFIAEAIKTMN